MAAHAPRLTVGDSLGSYQLIAPIAAGGMGEVWRAFDSGLRRHVALKFLPAHYAADPDRLRRFEQEAHAAGILNHPNVLSVYAIGRHEGFPYIVTELLEGMTLRQRLAAGALPEAKALEYADQLIQGLVAAHDRGIVHRDLKPDNVFVTADDRLKILDFGLAKLAPAQPENDLPTQTASGVVLGTPGYMAPEQVRGQPVDHRTDIFAVGVILFEMVAGRRLFAAETSAETMTAVLREAPPPIPGVSAGLEQIIRHCLEKEPAARCQSARDLAFQLRLVGGPHVPRHSRSASGIRSSRVFVIGAIALVAAVGVTWWLARPVSPAALRPLTADAGLTTDPALSADGQLVAYASDRAGSGNLDIWRQQLSTGETVRLTSDPADESEPAFSPDGSRIAFRSERDGGGIWVISAFGGEPRLVARQGRRPKFSPDGAEIAYWVAVGPWYVGNLFVVPAIGGTPASVASEFASASHPLWSADGQSLLFLGARDPHDIPTRGQDWWVVRRNGGPATKSGAADVLRRQAIDDDTYVMRVIPPAAWVDDHVFFSGSSGGSTNLWRLAIPARTGKTDGEAAQKLTSGTSVESAPSVIPGGRLVFASLKRDLNIWSLPIDANGGRVLGDVQQVTGSAFDAHTSLSSDGTKLVFVSARSGNADVWMKDLISGKETALTVTPQREEQSEISADGTRVSYMVWQGPSTGTLHEIATTGGVSQEICKDCYRPWDWSPDGQKLLYMIPEGLRQPGLALGLFDRTTRQHGVFLEHPDYAALARARFSPDGQWVSLMAVNRTGTYRVVIVPFQGGAGPPEERWLTIAPESTVALDKPRWSPDGNLLYYVTEADGFRCVKAQRLEPATKRPIGPPIDVYHSHQARRSLMNAWFGALEISLTSDRLFFNMGETTGNIWLAEWQH
jgi:serine/threonine protein kinase/Tol biopolymer transport system component